MFEVTLLKVNVEISTFGGIDHRGSVVEIFLFLQNVELFYPSKSTFT